MSWYWWGGQPRTILLRQVILQVHVSMNQSLSLLQTPRMKGEMLFLAAFHATLFASVQVLAQKSERGWLIVYIMLWDSP